MTTTDLTDYQAAKTFQSAPDAVFAALTSAEAITAWWTPATGSGAAGGQLTLTFGGQDVQVGVANADQPTQVSWAVLESEPFPDWTGTSMTFDLAPTADGGTDLRFTHHGLAQLECFSMCRAGWTQYLASLVDYVDRDGGNAYGSPTDQRAAALREHQADAAG